jgi:hypothetical protein
LQEIAGLVSSLLEIAVQVSYLTEVSDPVYLAVIVVAFLVSVAPVSASLAEIVDPVSLPVSKARNSVSPLVMYPLPT